MRRFMAVALCLFIAMPFTACSTRKNPSESESSLSARAETETSENAEISESRELDDTDIYPIKNADPSIGIFGNELLSIYSEELVGDVNQLLDKHRNGTFEEMPDHHPAYPADFPPVNLLPVIEDVDDIIVAWRESVMLDAYTEQSGGVYVVVPIDESHIYILDPAKFSDEDGNITIGFGYSGFGHMSVEEFIEQSGADFWFGGR